LASLWREASRFKTFGNVLTKLVVRGVRCHRETTVEILSPITAFSGYNGTGKSTLIQLAAAVYESEQRYSINSFVRKGPLDQTVFSSGAQVQCEFEDERGTKPLTLSYNPKTSRWQGYARRPKRKVFFSGVGVFLPRSEQQDFVFRNSTRLTLAETSPLPDDLKRHIRHILSSGPAGHGYLRGSRRTELLGGPYGLRRGAHPLADQPPGVAARTVARPARRA
jgi:hypothetical protein